jgi:deoxyribodipyrimidine photo-lyase
VLQAVDAFIEELVVRRELSDNFCFYNQRYDDLSGMYPAFDNNHWAQQTLATHAHDVREFVYTLEEVRVCIRTII